MKMSMFAALFAFVMHQSCSAATIDASASLEGTEWVTVIPLISMMFGIGFYDGHVWDCYDNDCLCFGDYDKNSFWTIDENGEKHILGRALPFLGIGYIKQNVCWGGSEGLCYKGLSPMVKLRGEFVPECFAGWRDGNGESIGNNYLDCPEGDNCTCGNY
jgi:hypothetical protein